MKKRLLISIIVSSLSFGTNVIRAESDSQVVERVRKFRKAGTSLTLLGDIRVSKGLNQVSADDVALIFHQRGDDLFGGGESIEKYTAARNLCEIVEFSDEPLNLVPILVQMASKVEVYVPKQPNAPGRDWNDILFESTGGRLGLILSSILEISGEEGLKSLYQQFSNAGQAKKIGVLCNRLVRLPKEAKYLVLLRELQRRENNLEINAQVSGFLNSFRGSKE